MIEQLDTLENVLCALIDPYKSTQKERDAAVQGHIAIKEIRAEIEKQYERENTPILFLPVSARTKNALAMYGIHLVRQVITYKGNLALCRGVGKIGHAELMQAIQKHLSTTQVAPSM